MTWSRSTTSSENCLWRGMCHFLLFRTHMTCCQVKLFAIEQVHENLFLCRPFRPSLSSFSRISSSLKQVQDLSVLGDNLLRDIELVGGNNSGIFVSSVKPGSLAEKAGLREGHHLLLVNYLFAVLVKPKSYTLADQRQQTQSPSLRLSMKLLWKGKVVPEQTHAAKYNY